MNQKQAVNHIGGPRATAAINDNVAKLRAAIFDEDGRDKDVTKGLAPSFMKYDRNGLNMSISFTSKLTKSDAQWAFDLTKQNMEELYDASGYGWDDDDKMKELTEDGARFLIVKSEDVGTSSAIVAYVHFRFTVQGEVLDKMAGEPSLYVYDLHVAEDYQRKGLSKHLLVILELIARREKMKLLSLPIMLGHDEAQKWITEGVNKGFAVDDTLHELGFDADMEGFEVYSKVFSKNGRAKVPTIVPSAGVAAENNENVAMKKNKQELLPTAKEAQTRSEDGVVKDTTTLASPSKFTGRASAATTAGDNGTEAEEVEREVEGGWLCL
mmetsp:Transcript_30358/g.51342  ORF Transcript_30358/g.51342 Transcript_30358/m.51342 type:complete len:325 (-) Transcript_30358:276-1250(-)